MHGVTYMLHMCSYIRMIVWLQGMGSDNQRASGIARNENCECRCYDIAEKQKNMSCES